MDRKLIIDALRNFTGHHFPRTEFDLANQAADEIERLRVRVQQLEIDLAAEKAFRLAAALAAADQ